MESNSILLHLAKNDKIDKLGHVKQGISCKFFGAMKILLVPLFTIVVSWCAEIEKFVEILENERLDWSIMVKPTEAPKSEYIVAVRQLSVHFANGLVYDPSDAIRKGHELIIVRNDLFQVRLNHIRFLDDTDPVPIDFDLIKNYVLDLIDLSY